MGPKKLTGQCVIVIGCHHCNNDSVKFLSSHIFDELYHNYITAKWMKVLLQVNYMNWEQVSNMTHYKNSILKRQG